MKRLIRKPANTLVTLLSLVLIQTGCTHFSFKFDEDENKVVNVDKKARQAGPIVQHVGHSAPIITKLDRDSWVEIRKKTNRDTTRLYAALGAREWSVAIQDARAYLARRPKDIDGLTVLATALAMDKQYSLAAYYANIIERNHPGLSLVPNLKGLAVLHRGNVSMRDFKQATDHFQEALDRSDTEVAAGLNLGHLYLATGQAKDAAVVFQGVQSRCGSCIESLLGTGIAFSHTGDYEKARSAFEAVLKRQENNALALYRLALVEKHGFRNNDKAKAHLDRLLTQSSDSNMDLKRRANVLLRQMQARDNAPAMANEGFIVEKHVVSDTAED